MESFASHTPEPEAYELFQRGSLLLKQRHPAQAVMLLERAARLCPGKNSIREALAQACFDLRLYERAAELFADIVDDVPVNDYAHFGLGCALVKLGRLSEARKHFRLAVALRPDQAEYRVRLARCELQVRRDPCD